MRPTLDDRERQQIGIIPPGMTFWALPWTELPNHTRDVNRAQDLLAEAGFTRGIDLKIRTIIGFPALAAGIQIIADQLNDAGFNVTVQVSSTPDNVPRANFLHTDTSYESAPI